MGWSFDERPLMELDHQLARPFDAHGGVPAEGVGDAQRVGGERDAERECVLEG